LKQKAEGKEDKKALQEQHFNFILQLKILSRPKNAKTNFAFFPKNFRITNG
jgi:hypothetical protein